VIDPDNTVNESNENDNTVVGYVGGDAPQLEVILDKGSRVKTAVRTSGGTLDTTSSGIRFILTIPRSALLDMQEISLTAVSAITGLPLSSGMLAAVQIGPEELRLLKPATLTIELPSNIDMSGLVGFLSRDDGEGFHLYPVKVDGQSVTFQLMHFTLGGVGGSSCIDISALENTIGLTPEDTAKMRMAVLEQ
jgi:hypothetical protein